MRSLAELRAETGFAWSCRTVEAERGQVTRACEVSGSDRAEYAAHHKTHGRAPLKSGYESWKPWRAPRPVREYAPKPMDAGQRVTWTSKPRGGHYEVPGHWEGEPYASRYVAPSGEFIHDPAETRTGTVWSVADTGTAWWVVPDDDPSRPVYVKRHGRKYSSEYREGELYEVAGYADRARANILRGNIVRERGIFAVIDRESSERVTWNGPARTNRHLLWHSDRACARAAGKTAWDGSNPQERKIYTYGRECEDSYGRAPWTALHVARVLAHGGQMPSELCPECIVNLDIDAPAQTEAPAVTEAAVPAAELAATRDGLCVTDVTDGGHSVVYEVSGTDGDVAAHADMLGPGGTIRVLWGGRDLTHELCAQVREAVREYRAGFDPATGIGPDDRTWRILCERGTPGKRRDYALMCAQGARDDAFRAAAETLAGELAAVGGDRDALPAGARQQEAEARLAAAQAYQRVRGDIEAAYLAETGVAS